MRNRVVKLNSNITYCISTLIVTRVGTCALLRLFNNGNNSIFEGSYDKCDKALDRVLEGYDEPEYDSKFIKV